MKSGIYKITNKINGKSYIGQSTNMSRRISDHFRTTSSESSNDLYKDIERFGAESFEVDVLENCGVEDLNEREIFYIEKYETYLSGYNQTRGGAGGSGSIKLSYESVNKITKLLKTTDKSHREIAEEFGVSTEMIQGINTGRHWRRNLTYPIQVRAGTRGNPTIYTCSDCGVQIASNSPRCTQCSQIAQRKVERPSKIDLAKAISKRGFSAVGREHGVTGNTIKKWCKAYNIPHLKKELVEWYNKNKG